MTDIFETMTSPVPGMEPVPPEMPEEPVKVPEPVSFTRCMLHETKKVSKPYFLTICFFIDALAGLFAVWWFATVYGPGILSGIGSGWKFVTDAAGFFQIAAISGLKAIAFAIPWWLYVIILLCSPPVIYATEICVRRRYKIKLSSLAFCFTISYGIAFVVGEFFNAFVIGISPVIFLILGTLITVLMIQPGSDERYAWRVYE